MIFWFRKFIDEIIVEKLIENNWINENELKLKKKEIENERKEELENRKKEKIENERKKELENRRKKELENLENKKRKMKGNI